MKKSFTLSTLCLVILAFLTGLSSCSGMMSNHSLRTGSVSFSLDKSVFDAARSGNDKESEPGYRIEISLKDRRGNEIVETVNISWQDYEKCRETDRKMTTSIPKVPVGKKYTAYVKIFWQEPEKEKDHEINPVNDPTVVEEEFERVPEIFGKSEEFTVKSGKNEVILYAYNFIHGFDFSITLNFEENETPNIQTYLTDMMIRAYASDSPAAARLTGLKDDKYQMYDFMGEYFEMEGELSPYSSEANFSLNPDKKSATAKGKIYLPVDINDPANSGEEVLLAAMVYNNENPEGAKPVLFGKTGPVTPKKGQTASSTISLKTLDIVNTPVVTYNKEDEEYSYYVGNNATPLQVNSDSFCFDKNGFFYTLSYDPNLSVAEYTVISNKWENGVSIGQNDNLLSLTTDLKTNILYSYYTHEYKIVIYKHPYLISTESDATKIDYSFIPQKTDEDSGETRSLPPANCVIHDDVAYIIASDTYTEDNWGTFLFAISLKGVEPGEIETPIFEKKLELPEGQITDMLYMDGAIYLLINKRTDFFSGGPSMDFPLAYYSRGALVKYNISDGSTKIIGWTDSPLDNTGKYIYATNESREQLYEDANCEIPAKIAETDVEGKDVGGDLVLFPKFYVPEGLNDANHFYGPQKFIAIKPKKLVIADDGLAFYTDADNAYRAKNANRIVTVNLETFAMSVEASDAEFDFKMSSSISSSGFINVQKLDNSFYSGVNSLFGNGDIWLNIPLSE